MSVDTRNRQPFASSISANEAPIAEHTPADGRGADAGGDNRRVPSSSDTPTGTKARSGGNGPNTPSRASFRHLNS